MNGNIDTDRLKCYTVVRLCILRKRGSTMAKRVQFVLTDAEYEQLQAIVADKGVTISKYVKDRVMPKKDNFELVWNEFSEKLQNYPAQTEFSVAQILTDERWDTLDKSTKLSIARLFNKNVSNGEYSNVVYIGRSSSNVSLYKKISG